MANRDPRNPVTSYPLKVSPTGPTVWWSPIMTSTIPPEGFPQAWVITFIVASHMKPPDRITPRFGVPLRVEQEHDRVDIIAPSFRIWFPYEPPAPLTTRINTLIRKLWPLIVPRGLPAPPPVLADTLWSWDPPRRHLVAIIISYTSSERRPIREEVEAIDNLERWARDFQITALDQTPLARGGFRSSFRTGTGGSSSLDARVCR